MLFSNFIVAAALALATTARPVPSSSSSLTARFSIFDAKDADARVIAANDAGVCAAEVATQETTTKQRDDAFDLSVANDPTRGPDGLPISFAKRSGTLSLRLTSFVDPEAAVTEAQKELDEANATLAKGGNNFVSADEAQLDVNDATVTKAQADLAACLAKEGVVVALPSDEPPVDDGTPRGPDGLPILGQSQF